MSHNTDSHKQAVDEAIDQRDKLLKMFDASASHLAKQIREDYSSLVRLEKINYSLVLPRALDRLRNLNTMMEAMEVSFIVSLDEALAK